MMKISKPDINEPSNSLEIDRVLDEIGELVRQDSPFDFEEYCQKYPEMAEQLRKLRPTIEAIALIGKPDANSIDTASPVSQQTLGDFHIIGEIGRGGMGVVYEAQQLSIKRKVAIKILPLAALVDPRSLQRFKNEVAAIATLDHPNIVSVYAIGEERGINYYAMQLIRGQSLAAVCRALHLRATLDGSVSGPSIHQVVFDLLEQQSESHDEFSAEKMNSQVAETSAETVARGQTHTAVTKFSDPTYYRNVAQLVLQAANALQHAHDHGIVHRDVKPANLLLDTTGTLFVTDFGLARIETGSGVTITGDVLGTLRYMSPEQVLAGRVIIDHRTDVYSLGATLYEMLTLQPMWDGEDRAGLIRMISFEEPSRPQKLNPSIPTDLETIALKAISKNPDDRYENAQSFGSDLQRFLDLKPVLAKRPTLLQQVSKWTRRHPAFVGAALLLMVMVTAVSVVSTALVLAANNRTEKALVQARTDAAIAEAVNEFVNTLLGKANPHAEPNRNLEVSEVLDRALVEIEGQFDDQPLVEAAIRITIARALNGLGRYDEEKREREIIHGIYERESGPLDRETLKGAVALVRNTHDRGMYRAALHEIEPLLECCEQHYGREDYLTLQMATLRADLRRHFGEYREAEKELFEILAIQEPNFGPEHTDTLATISYLAMVSGDQGRYQDSERLHRRVLAARQDNTESPSTLSTQTELAAAIWRQGRYAEAAKLARDTLETSKRVFGDVHRQTLRSIKQLAFCLDVIGRRKEAEELLRNSIEDQKRLLGPRHSSTLRTIDRLAQLLMGQGRNAEAEELSRDVLDLLGPEEADSAETLRGKNTLAVALESQLKLQEAEELIREVVEKRKSLLGDKHADTLFSMTCLASLLLTKRHYEEMERISRDLVDAYQHQHGPKYPETLKSLRLLADALSGQGRQREAVPIYGRVVEVQKQELRPNHPDTLIAMHNLAVNYWQSNQLEQSIPVFEELVDSYKTEYGEDHPNTLRLLQNLGINYKDAGRLDKAISLLEKGHTASKDHPSLLYSTGALIDAYVRLGETDRAEVLVPEYLKSLRSKLPKTMVASHMAILARDYYLATQKFDEAERVLRECLAIFKKEMPDNPSRFALKFRLGLALAGQQKFSEAEPHLLEGFDGMLQRETPMAPISVRNVIESINRISALYADMHVKEPDHGHDAKAAEWRRKREEFKKKILKT